MQLNLNQFSNLVQRFRTEFPQTFKTRLVEVSKVALMGKMIERIFEDGLDSKDSVIGSYSTKPMYAPKGIFVKASAFKPKGKKSSKNKTMLLEGGYKQFREIQGRPTDKVNLDLSSDLRSSIQLVSDDNTVVIGISNKVNSNKARGNEKRFKKRIFSPSPNDIEYFKEKLGLEARQIIKEILT